MNPKGQQPANDTQPPVSRRRPNRFRRLELKLLRKLGLADDGDAEFDCPLCRQEWLDRQQQRDEEP